MSQRELNPDLAPEAIRGFTKSLLEDLRALEQILADGIIESDKQRIGAEQEFFLVDSSWRSAPVAIEIIPALEAFGFTTELARFNLETNLDPLLLTGSCFSTLERQLTERVALFRQEAAKHGANVVITGILPSLIKFDCVTNLGHAAVAFEGGQNENPASTDNLEAAIWVALDSATLLDTHNGRVSQARNTLSGVAAGLPKVVEILHRHVTAAGDGFRMSNSYQGFDRVTSGQLLATDATGDITAPVGGYLLMPLYQKQGNDGFFLAHELLHPPR